MKKTKQPQRIYVESKYIPCYIHLSNSSGHIVEHADKGYRFRPASFFYSPTQALSKMDGKFIYFVIQR